MLDNHPKEMKAMELFRKGQREEATRLQDEFLAEVKDSGQDPCSCPAKCRHHGNCVECVIIHRGHGDHVPTCFRAMVNQRVEALSALTEHSGRRRL